MSNRTTYSWGGWRLTKRKKHHTLHMDFYHNESKLNSFYSFHISIFSLDTKMQQLIFFSFFSIPTVGFSVLTLQEGRSMFQAEQLVQLLFSQRRDCKIKPSLTLSLHSQLLFFGVFELFSTTCFVQVTVKDSGWRLLFFPADL